MGWASRGVCRRGGWYRAVFGRRGRALAAAWLAAALVAPAVGAGAGLPAGFSVPAVKGWEFPAEKIVAREEHSLFEYVVVRAASSAEPPGRRAPSLLRRFVGLGPSLWLVDDVLRRPKETARWILPPGPEPAKGGRQVTLAMDDRRVTCRLLWPAEGVYRAAAAEAGAPAPRELALSDDGTAPIVRAIHLVSAVAAGQAPVEVQAEVTEREGRIQLKVTTAERTYRLALPPADRFAGAIAVTGADGSRLLPRRVFPSGVLPGGPEGRRLLERWDSAYRREGRPGWDTGRPSSNLKKFLDEGGVEPCRAVVFGCGTGTNAVFLAEKGFQVTGIDIAPTALNLARKKAREAEVRVRWLLADVLAPPDLGPFDFIFDRGCYHGVRRQNAAGYVQTLRKLSRPGTQILILAGNANEARQYGPPRVKEEEIRREFADGFQIVGLEETHFDTQEEGAPGALAWRILLKRTE